MVLGLLDPWEAEESADYDDLFGDLTFETMNELQYLHAFVSEVGERTHTRTAWGHTKILAVALPLHTPGRAFRSLYTTICTSQVVRLHPPVPRTARFATKADVLPDGTHIKPGDVCTNARAVDLPGRVSVHECKTDRVPLRACLYIRTPSHAFNGDALQATG